MKTTAICTYRVKPGSEAAFRELLNQHWPTLHRLGLAADQPSVAYQGEDEEGRPVFVEILRWKDGAASGRAHELPDVMSVWERMGALCEARGGKPSMEFPHCEPIELVFAGS